MGMDGRPSRGPGSQGPRVRREAASVEQPPGCGQQLLFCRAEGRGPLTAWPLGRAVFCGQRTVGRKNPKFSVSLLPHSALCSFFVVGEQTTVCVENLTLVCASTCFYLSLEHFFLSFMDM